MIAKVRRLAVSKACEDNNDSVMLFMYSIMYLILNLPTYLGMLFKIIHYIAKPVAK